MNNQCQNFASNFRIRPLSGNQNFQLCFDFLFLPVSKILLPTPKFGLCLATKFSNWLKIGDGGSEIFWSNSLQNFWSEVVWEVRNEVEGIQLEKSRRNFLIGWIASSDDVMGSVLVSARWKFFGRPVRHRCARLKFWFQRVLCLLKFWVRGYSDLDDWCTRNLRSF